MLTIKHALTVVSEKSNREGQFALEDQVRIPDQNQKIRQTVIWHLAICKETKETKQNGVFLP